jgi:hypothetical protein
LVERDEAQGEIRLGMDCSAFAVTPFSSIGERHFPVLVITSEKPDRKISSFFQIGRKYDFLPNWYKVRPGIRGGPIYLGQ